MTEWTKNAIPLGGDNEHLPPFSKDRQDAELEALRFAFLELAAALHEAGTLDLDAVAGRLGNAEWLYVKKPKTRESVQWLADTLKYQRAKLGEPGQGHE